MKLLHSFLINAIYRINQVIKFLFHNNDFTVINRCIEYKVDHSKNIHDIDNLFWERESLTWVQESSEYFSDFKETDNIAHLPECVTDTLVRYKFWYNNKVYKFLTYDPNFKWPPVKSMGVNFNIPLSSAQLMDCDDKPVKDMLAKIGRYAGPFNDFYKSDVKIKDMLWYNDETRKNVPTIKLRNRFGMTKIVSTETGLLTDLRIP
jgi:hypothetical protein